MRALRRAVEMTSHCDGIMTVVISFKADPHGPRDGASVYWTKTDARRHASIMGMLNTVIIRPTLTETVIEQTIRTNTPRTTHFIALAISVQCRICRWYIDKSQNGRAQLHSFNTTLCSEKESHKTHGAVTMSNLNRFYFKILSLADSAVHLGLR